MRVSLFVGRRLLRMAVSLLIVSIITFGLLKLAPGSFAGIAALGAGATGLARERTQLGADRLQATYGDHVPAYEQYWKWLSGAVRGDLGPSYKYPGSNVQDIIMTALPVSSVLALLGMLLALLVAVPAGVIAAARKDSIWDRVLMFGATATAAIPNYLAAIVLVLVFSLGLHLLPTSGWTGPANMVLPILALALGPAGMMARYVRSSVLEVLQEEYVVAAAARGGSRRTILYRHVLRNSLIPLITVSGPALAGMMVGTIFIETIFSVPGLGLYFTQAAVGRDMPLLMGCTIVFAALVMVMNLVVDLAYAMLDPRTKAGLGLADEPVRRGRSGWWRRVVPPVARPAPDSRPEPVAEEWSEVIDEADRDGIGRAGVDVGGNVGDRS